MWYVEVEQEHQNGVIVLQNLTNAASVQYGSLSLYLHIDIYFTVLPAICDENVWTFTRTTRIYPLCNIQWISQVSDLNLVFSRVILHILSSFVVVWGRGFRVLNWVLWVWVLVDGFGVYGVGHLGFLGWASLSYHRGISHGIKMP